MCIRDRDIHATSVSLDITEKTAERYDDFQLTATIAPLNFTDAAVWTSSNEEVATVSDTGYVEICGVGTAVTVSYTHLDVYKRQH